MRKPPKGTTVPEFAAIVAAADARNLDAHDLILFLGETGWRFSEGTALDVGHVEDDGLDVGVTVGQVFRIDGTGRQVLSVDEAKSYAGFRRIRLFPASAAVVRRRLVGKAPGDLARATTTLTLGEAADPPSPWEVPREGVNGVTNGLFVFVVTEVRDSLRCGRSAGPCPPKNLLVAPRSQTPERSGEDRAPYNNHSSKEEPQHPESVIEGQR